MAQTTKKAIAASLKQLLARKPLSKITIADIAEDCGINRMTFYYHFQDIYDLIAWICQEEGGRALEGHKDYRTWQEGFAALCRTVVDNRAFVEGVYRSVQREQIERYLVGAVFGLLLPVVEERSRGVDISPEAQRLIAGFYTYAFVGVMLDWVKGGFREPPEAIAGQISQLAHGQLDAAIGNMARLH